MSRECKFIIFLSIIVMQGLMFTELIRLKGAVAFKLNATNYSLKKILFLS